MQTTKPPGRPRVPPLHVVTVRLCSRFPKGEPIVDVCPRSFRTASFYDHASVTCQVPAIIRVNMASKFRDFARRPCSPRAFALKQSRHDPRARHPHLDRWDPLLSRIRATARFVLRTRRTRTGSFQTQRFELTKRVESKAHGFTHGSELELTVWAFHFE